MNKQKIIDRIDSDWGKECVQSKICIDILDYLMRNSNRNISHITHRRLRDMVKVKCDDIELLQSVQYLCGERVHLLDLRFEFIEGDLIFPLSNSEVKSAQKSGELVHPFTGELITVFEDKVFIYFEPSNFIKTII